LIFLGWYQTGKLNDDLSRAAEPRFADCERQDVAFAILQEITIEAILFTAIIISITSVSGITAARAEK
jgi:hypothetical protein